MDALLKRFEQVEKLKFLSTDTTSADVRLREMKLLGDTIPTDYLALEFGVFRGTTINALADSNPHLRIHGFDSFEGLPEDWDTGHKFIGKDVFDLKGIMPEVRENVTLHKGWFEDTIPKFIDTLTDKSHLYGVRPIGFINVDSDLYSSAATILNLLNKYIKPGCIIRFDELCCWRSTFNEASTANQANRVMYTKWRDHEWKALNEWILNSGRVVIPIWRDWFQAGTVVVIK